MNLLTFNLRLQKKNLKMMSLIIVMLTIALAIQNAVLLIFINNTAFYQSQIGTASDSDLFVYFQRFDGEEAIIADSANQLFEDLNEQGIPVSTELFTYDIVNGALPAENRMPVFFSKSLDANECILSPAASRILNADKAGEVFITSLDKTFSIKTVEPSSVMLQNAFQLGVITISDTHLNTYQNMQGDNNRSDNLNISVRIDGTGVDYSQLYKNVLETVNPRFASPENPNSITVISPEDNYHSGSFISETVETLLGILSVISIIITMVAMLSFFKLHELQNEKKFCILRVLGMKKSHSLFFAIYDTITIVAIVSVLSIVIGYVIFNSISFSTTGIKTLVPFFSIDVARTALQSFVLTFFIVFICKMWGYSRIFSIPISDTLQNRPKPYKKDSSFLWIIAGFVGTLFLTSVFLSNFTLIIYVIIIMLIVLLIYSVISIFYAIFSNVNIELKNSCSLSLILAQSKKRAFKLLAAITSVIVVFITALYLVQYGIDANLQSYWISTSNANVFITVPQDEKAEMEDALTEQGIKHYISYTKSFEHKNDPRVYTIGLIDDPNGLVSKLTPLSGEYYALPYFVYRENVEVDDMFEFPLGLEVKLKEILPKAPEFPGSFTVSLNYNDAKHLIDESFAVNFMLNINKQQLLELTPLLPENTQVATASEAIDNLKLIFADYINLAVIGCLLISIVLILFLLFLCLSAALIRKNEFAIYRAQGAGFFKLIKIVIIENLFIGIIGAIASFLLIFLFANGALYLLLESAAYSIPIPIVLLITALSALIITIASCFSVNSVYKFIVKELRYSL